MASLQNPRPSPNPAQHPTTKSLSFDEVSNFFHLPLFDAADSLGVCTNVLKKICYDNGLVRWPYRKFLAGKSIEEIKKAAVIEKSKELAKMPSFAGERGSEPPNKTTSSAQELSKSRIVAQPQGSKNSETGNLQNVYSSNLTKGTHDVTDEFKYGFPSNGLSTVSYRWWGNNNPADNNSIQVCSSECPQEKEQPSEDPVDNSPPDGEKSKNHVDGHGMTSLSVIRRRAVKEGKKALKLGVYQGSGVHKLDQTKRDALLQIFKSSLPNQWDMSRLENRFLTNSVY